MLRRRPFAAVSAAVLLAALLAVTAPQPSADAVPAVEALPPHFSDATADSAFAITVNGVSLISDATGFNHWGGQMPLYAARTGLLVEADRVRIRVERSAAVGPFSVGLQVVVCGESDGGFACEPIEDVSLQEYALMGDECDAAESAVVVPVLSNGEDPNPYGYLNNRRAFLVGASTTVGAVERFDCSLTMSPAGLSPIATIFLEAGAPSTFRSEAAQFITGEAGWLGESEPDATYDGIVDDAGCDYRPGSAATELKAAITAGGTADDLDDVLDCPDGRIDLGEPDNEAHVLPAFANPRVFADGLTEWRAVDITDPAFDPFAPAAISTLRVPTCSDSAGAMPCLQSITDGWGMNLTDVSTVLPGVTLPSAELTLVRTAVDPAVGYGTVAQSGAGDRVSFALRVPTGTVRGASWANMVRAAGYLFAEVVAYGIDTSPDDHVVLSATLEPRTRSSALDSATFGFQCQVTVSGGSSTAEDCDIPDGFLEIDQLRMFPRAWVSAAHGSEASPSYRATKKVQGWRIDTASCDATDATLDPWDDCDEPGVLVDVPDPDGDPTIAPVYDRLYSACGSAVYVEESTELISGGFLNEILSEDAECDPFVESASPDCGSPTEGDFCPIGTRVVHVEVRNSSGLNASDPETGRPFTTAALTDESGAFLLFTDAAATTPLALSIGDPIPDCTGACSEVEVPALRLKAGGDTDASLAVYTADGTWTYTRVQTVTPACAEESEGVCQQGRRIDWLSATDGSDDFVLPLGDSIVSVTTETAHGYQTGDRIRFGGMESTELDGRTGLTILDRSIFAFAFTVPGDVVTALVDLGDADPNDCARDGAGFIDVFTLCAPDVADFEMNPSRMVLRTGTPHGLGSPGTPLTGDDRVTTTLLGNEFDGTFEAIVVDADEIAIDGSWFATNAYSQPRDGVLVQGTSSKVVITETTLTMYLEGLPANRAALAGGFVATNGQTFTFGEDLLAGRAFDFAVAGPSRTAEGLPRSSDGFFQAFIPAAFLDETFELTVAGAVNALEVNRRNAGSVGTVGFEGNPDIVTGTSGLLISSDGFSYSAPYFAAERRTDPGEPPAGTRGPITLPGGVTPTVAPGLRTATLGGRPVDPESPVVASNRMVLSVGGSTIGVGGPGGLGGLAVREEGGQRIVDLLQGSSFPLTGEGFQPGSVVEVWLFSDPQLLALARVDATGRLTGEVPLDGWSSGGPIPTGPHTLQVSGVTADGQVVAFNVGVEVVTALRPTRAGAGSSASAPASDATPGDTAVATPSTPSAPPTPPTSTPEQPAAAPDAAAPTGPDAPTEPSTGTGGRLALVGGGLAALLAAYGLFETARRRRAGAGKE